MMRKGIIASSLKFRRLVVALAAGLVVFGAVQLRHVPVDQLPEFGPTMVEVRTEALDSRRARSNSRSPCRSSRTC